MPLPLLQLTSWIWSAACGPSGCDATTFTGHLAGLAAPILLAWAAAGAHDVYRMVNAHLEPPERRLYAIATALRALGGLLVAIGIVAGITSLIAPAMLAAAATLVVGSTWFERGARARRPEAT
jgi:hypothetical protein